MARPAFGSRPTCEGCMFGHVRRWHREPLRAGQPFSYSWNCGGEPGHHRVRAEQDAVFLIFESRRWGDGEWKTIKQRPCQSPGRRVTLAAIVPGFDCSVYTSGQCCGRRVALLYVAGELFACRRCYGLAYASQQETPAPPRSWNRAQKDPVMRLGGSPEHATGCFRKGRAACTAERTNDYAKHMKLRRPVVPKA